MAQHVLEVVFGLPRADQVELLEQLRDRLGADATGSEFDAPGSWTLSDEDRRILDERLDEVERDPDGGVPWEQAKADILAGLVGRK